MNEKDNEQIKEKTLKPETDIELWAKFFCVKTESDLAMLESKNKELFCGVTDDLRAISQDEIKRKAAFKRERAIADYNNRYDDGRVDERVNTIRKLFERGDSVQSIADLYAIPEEEVQNIIDGYVIDI